MSDVVSGLRCGAFLVLKDEHGLRHAVRHLTILAISNADDTSTSTLIHLPGNRTATIRCSLDQVLAWFA